MIKQMNLLKTRLIFQRKNEFKKQRFLMPLFTFGTHVFRTRARRQLEKMIKINDSGPARTLGKGPFWGPNLGPKIDQKSSKSKLKMDKK